MEFTPLGLSVGGLLQSEKFYKIPKYQRDYVWTDKKIKDLWNDIIFNLQTDENLKYFLGSFIIKTSPDGKEIVVDGQQRLTSLLLLLGNICREYIKISDEFNIDYTKKYCVLGDTEIQKVRSRLLNDDYPILEYIMQYCISNIDNSLEDYLEDIGCDIDKKSKRFVAGYNIYNESIKEYLKDVKEDDISTYLTKLRDAILKISIVKIQVADTRSASLVFETINARGQTLEVHDLIKNYLFMYEKVVGGRSLFEKKWEQIIESIEKCKDPSIPRFFTHYCTSFFGKKKQGEIYETYKNNTPRNDVSKRIKSLEEVSKIYVTIVNGSDNIRAHKELNYYLSCFNELGISILRPVLISVLLAFKNNKIDYQTLCKEMKRLVSFFSIYVGICSIKTNTLEELIYSTALELQKNFSVSLFKNFIDNLNLKRPSFDDFCVSFKQLAYSKYKNKYSNVVINKKKVQYVLKEFELFILDNEDFVVPDFSIEHIKDDTDGGNACYIGNFIPLPPRKNGKLAGKTMVDKQKLYEKSSFASTRKFSQHNECLNWNDESIEKRSKAMAKEFYDNIWKV